jgi:hypothetical protein
MNRTLTLPSWREAQGVHKKRAEALTVGRRARKQIGERDPVDDFMFEYYPYTPTKLETWFPGVGITLEIDSAETFDFPNYSCNGTSCELDTQYLTKHRSRIHSTLELLRNTQLREATFNCFGLHEWAMVYQADQHDIRHGDPLRVTQEQIDSLIVFPVYSRLKLHAVSLLCPLQKGLPSLVRPARVYTLTPFLKHTHSHHPTCDSVSAIIHSTAVFVILRPLVGYNVFKFKGC